jgi:hypothetical protein
MPRTPLAATTTIKIHDVKSRRRFDQLRQVVPRKLHDPLTYHFLSCYALYEYLVLVGIKRILRQELLISAAILELPPSCLPLLQPLSGGISAS